MSQVVDKIKPGEYFLSVEKYKISGFGEELPLSMPF